VERQKRESLNSRKRTGGLDPRHNSREKGLGSKTGGTTAETPASGREQSQRGVQFSLKKPGKKFAHSEDARELNKLKRRGLGGIKRIKIEESKK